MQSLADIQSAFAAAVSDSAAPIPEAVVARGESLRRTRGFAAYRNNFIVALVNLLAARFPVVERIVGAEFFQAATRAFVNQQPPRGTLNHSYGQGFAHFLAVFPPASGLPYLADVARIEWARHESAIAQEANVLTASALACLPPDALFSVRPVMHPALRAVSSAFPAVTIWEANRAEGPVGAIDPGSGPEDALIARPDSATSVHRIQSGGAVFIEALVRGQPLGTAGEASLEATPSLDLEALFATLLAAGAFSAINHDNREGDRA